MKKNELLGEFALIKIIKKITGKPSKDVVAGIGDDAAVLNYDKNNYMLIATDIIVEKRHFTLKYWDPCQIGMLAIEKNVSDIAAMGGIPKFAVVSVALPSYADSKFVEKLYEGIKKSAGRYKIEIVGGDMSSSNEIAVNVAMIGFVGKKFLALRSGAKTGDLIFCSADVGKSAAGLELLRKNKNGKSAKRHLHPKSRLDLARKLVKIGISSMIDVSDGVSSGVRNICEESKVGAVIYAGKIPISEDTARDSKKTGKDAIDLALYGGEDFELVFTAGENKLNKLKKLGVVVIGEIVSKKHGIKLARNGKTENLKGGFDHFRKK